MRKMKLLTVTVALIGVMALASACGGDQTASSQNGKNKKPNDASTIQVSGTVKTKNTENIVLNMPMDATAKITNVFVKNGQEVKKGDKLFEMDLSDYNAAINKQQNLIDIEYLKLDKMTDSDQKKLENKNIDGLTDELNNIKGKLNKPYINSNNVVCDMEDAVVSDIGYVKGDNINSQLKLLSLMDLKNIEIEAKIPEENTNDVKVGQSVTITTQSYSSKTYKGKVEAVGKEVIKSEKEDDTYIPVSISIDDNDGNLLPNASVDIDINRK
ncbi:MAG: efflux RND transporter periplasmic adaptor subunit [Bacillota bacterium]|nr:efflux RND transporter periplasmic adaptor subunit [Bacillota bacterium]